MVRLVRSGCMGVLLLVAGLSLSAQTTEIVFANRTGATIYFLYASASDADTWGEDLLGRTVFPDGATFRARLRSSAGQFDVRAVDANDNEYIVWGWQPGREARVVLDGDAFVGSRATTDTDDVLSWITIINDTNYDVVEVRVVPSDLASWSQAEQVLRDGDVIHHTEDVRIDINVQRYGTFVYDIMLVDEDGDRYVKRGVNLEVETRIVYTLDDLEWR